MTVAVAALIPIGAGLAGALFGIGSLDPSSVPSLSANSHGRYLSGLLLGVGLAYWNTVPNIESSGPRFRLLTLIVFTGGLARLLAAMTDGLPSPAMTGALGMELIVTPALALWRERVEQLLSR